MSTRLREAAARRLSSMSAPTAGSSVRRLTVDVEADGRLETVILSLRDGELHCVSSNGLNDGPHVAAALQLLAGPELGEESTPFGAVPLATADSAETNRLDHLADAFDDLLTAIARVGVEKAQYAPSVDAALERVLRAAPQPTPSGLGRFIGRLHQETRRSNPGGVARLLDGAARLGATIRSAATSRESEQRRSAWLGARPGSPPLVDLLYDRTMMEVGREWLSGTERACIERRYLVDVESGHIYREDRPRRATASLGPCPRALHVGLAEIEGGPAPNRVRVLQYEVHVDLRADAWEQLRQAASRSFAEVTEAYRRALRDYPSLSEPFVLIAPHRIECNGIFKAFDPEGHQLVLNRSERRGAALAFYDLLDNGAEPVWLAGRLTDVGNTPCLTPFALGTRDRPYIRL